MRSAATFGLIVPVEGRLMDGLVASGARHLLVVPDRFMDFFGKFPDLLIISRAFRGHLSLNNLINIFRKILQRTLPGKNIIFEILSYKVNLDQSLTLSLLGQA